MNGGCTKTFLDRSGTTRFAERAIRPLLAYPRRY